jgi:thioredoxin 1
MSLVEISGDTFEDEVIKEGLPVLVDYWSPKCTLCLSLMPKIEELA